jgi:hypothetical protein
MGFANEQIFVSGIEMDVCKWLQPERFVHPCFFRKLTAGEQGQLFLRLFRCCSLRQLNKGLCSDGGFIPAGKVEFALQETMIDRTEGDKIPEGENGIPGRIFYNARYR